MSKRGSSSNAEIDQAIRKAAASIKLGEVLVAEGRSVVAVDDEGRIVRYGRRDAEPPSR